MRVIISISSRQVNRLSIIFSRIDNHGKDVRTRAFHVDRREKSFNFGDVYRSRSATLRTENGYLIVFILVHSLWCEFHGFRDASCLWVRAADFLRRPQPASNVQLRHNILALPPGAARPERPRALAAGRCGVVYLKKIISHHCGLCLVLSPGRHQVAPAVDGLMIRRERREREIWGLIVL